MVSGSTWSSFSETLRSALGSLRAHKMRSALTTLGIIIGVASVIAVMSLTKSLEARIMAEVKQEGTHTFYLSSWVAPPRMSAVKVQRRFVDPETIRELRVMFPHITVASPQVYIFSQQMMIKYGVTTRRVGYLTAMDENGLSLLNLDLDCGRNFTSTDRVSRNQVAILGAKVAEDLGFTEAAIGKVFTIGGQSVELAGILKKFGEIPFMPEQDGNDNDTAMWGRDGMIYVPYGSFRQLAWPGAYNNPFWQLQVDSKIPVAVATEEMRNALRRIRGLRGEDQDNFRLESNIKAIEQVEKISKLLMTASLSMVGISLLVGGIGVMNIMLVSVTERTREIGIRKAIGARRKHILTQFLIEAIILCAVGGLIGLALGMGLGTLMSYFVMKHVGAVPSWAILSALIVPATTGLIFGLYPAAKASKLDPIEALRYE
jgi:putative ABC transport system permease protein